MNNNNINLLNKDIQELIINLMKLMNIKKNNCINNFKKYSNDIIE